MLGARYLTVLPIGLLLLAGCKQNKVAPLNDQQITKNIADKLAGDQSLQGQTISPAFASGVATLTGSATDETAREQAGADVGSIAGVRTVVNDLTLPAEDAAVCALTPVKRVHAHVRHHVERAAPIERVEEPASPPPPPPMRRVLYPARPIYGVPPPVYVVPPPPVVVVRPRPFVVYHRYWWR